MSNWISVDERLPDAGGIHLGGERVLIFYSLWKEIFIAQRVFTSANEWCWTDEEDYMYSPVNVAHWQPLPEPPQ